VKRLLTLAVVAVLVASSCTDEPDPDDPNYRLISIYSAVIPTVVTHDRPDLAERDELDLVVFVAARDGIEIPFDVQLGVVNELESWANIRFIDEFEEALIGVDDERTVRDGGVLIQLGPVPAGTASVEVTADRYEGVDHLLTFDLMVRRRAGEWSVDEPVSATPVRLSG
jgi:hypothetical protein